MFGIGELVVYGVHGVCRVTGTEKMRVDRKRVEYMVLESVTQENSRYYVPVESDASMARVHPVLTREDMETLLDSEEIREDAWIADEGQRKQYYRELLSSADRTAQLRMVASLYAYRTAQREAGKKFHLCDDNFLRDAERLLSSEIAVALEMTPELARNLLREKLGA